MKSNIEIKKIDITQLNVDAIVNAANNQLQKGGGVCGAIFRKAGAYELTKACSEIGHCKTGSAVITPGFNLKARYIIHAVGPIWRNGDVQEAKLLYNAYKQALTLAMENNCHSIGFPVISSGIYGCPKNEAWEIAIDACSDFIDDNQDYPLNIVFAVLSDRSKEIGEKVIHTLVDE
jgi:O-acetyl-ADP-ribose deacetylase (regulator of RNase III)